MSELAITSARQLPATDDKPKRLRLGKKLREVIDLMVFDGFEMNEAAKFAKTTTRAIRKAFEKRHVLQHVRTRKEVLRESICARNPLRLAEIRDQDENITGAVRAIQVLEQLGADEPSAASRGRSPGVVIVVNAGESAKPVTVQPIEHTDAD